jgi:hypothetical protein
VYNLIRHALATHPDWVVLSGDERSAFQRALRPEMRRQLVAKFPEFVNYFHCVYDGPTRLHYILFVTISTPQFVGIRDITCRSPRVLVHLIHDEDFLRESRHHLFGSQQFCFFSGK